MRLHRTDKRIGPPGTLLQSFAFPCLQVRKRACGCVPDLDRFIDAARCQSLPVWLPRNRHNSVGVPERANYQPLRSDVPDPSGEIRTCRRESSTVGAPRQIVGPQGYARNVTTLSPARVPEMVTVPFSWPEASSLSSGLHVRTLTPPGWTNSAVNLPVLASQILMAPSSPHAATRDHASLLIADLRVLGGIVISCKSSADSCQTIS